MSLESGKSDQHNVAVAPANLPEQTALAQIEGEIPSRQSSFGKWLVAGIVAIIVIALLWFGPQLWQLAQDQAALESWVASLGWWGPLALVALNAIQIVIAPIPGYVAQVAAGFLFGPFWGGLWASIGLLIGSTIAFWLARFYGRPLAGRLVGEDRLAQWEQITHSSSTLVWFVLLLGPIGDLPYFLAGLARVSFVKIFVITLAVRIPSTFVVAAAGAGIVLLTWWQIALLLVALLGLLLLFFRYQEQIVRWSDDHVQRRVERNLHNDIHKNNELKSKV
jgi:uncharacterized membrane protein YdjX (TVP38/TMEM64 family)